MRIGRLAGLPVGLIALMTLTTVALAATTALWHMEDPSTLVDSSGNGNNGTTDNITSGPGFSDNGYHFSGSPSLATVPSSDSLNPGSEDIKVTAHANFTQKPTHVRSHGRKRATRKKTASTYDLIRKGLATTSGGDYKMEILESGQARCTFRGEKSYDVSGGPDLADGRWHEISCVKTANDIQLIVDGQVYKKSANVGAISNDAPLTLGGKGQADWYRGDLDEVSVEVGLDTQPPATGVSAPSSQKTASLPQSTEAQPAEHSSTTDSSPPPDPVGSPKTDSSSQQPETDSQPQPQTDSQPQPETDSSSQSPKTDSSPLPKTDSSQPPTTNQPSPPTNDEGMSTNRL